MLQAAIQGRLTQQLPEDGDAEMLYQDIQKEKQKLIKEGKIKKEKSLSEITDDDIPFDIPESWKWVRLGNLGNFKKGPFGSSLTKSMFVPKSATSIKVYEQKNAIQKDWTLGDYYIRKEYFDSAMKGFEVFPGDIIVSCAGTIGETYVLPEGIEKGIINQALMRMMIFEPINQNYFLLFFDFMLKETARISSKGSAIKNIPPFDVFKNYLVPLPPLAEQKRIVACVDELMKRIDEMEKTEKDITALYAAFPGDMKASLLQAAIQGKLTEQLASDGDAETLYAESQKEKQRLIKEGKIKKEKPLPEITDDDIPFDIPENWKWVHIPDVTYFQEGPGILAVDFRSTGIPLIRISGMQGKIVTLNGCNYLDPTMVKEKWNHFRLEKGDIVISTSASMDKISEVTEEAEGAIPYTGQIRFKMYDGFDKRFFVYFIQSPFYTHQIEAQAAGAAIKHYGPSHLRKMLIPLPPLAEQKRIVEKLDQLLPLCDSMKEAIDATA